MKRHLSLIFLALSLVTLGQNRLTLSQLDTMVKNHCCHCDLATKKIESGFALGEIEMKLEFLDYLQKNKSILITGRVVDKKTLDRIPYCLVYSAVTTDTTCDIKSLLAKTDSLGNFKIKIKRDDTKSIYFRYVAYQDIELKIATLKLEDD
jgi:hypothetical protein